MSGAIRQNRRSVNTCRRPLSTPGPARWAGGAAPGGALRVRATSAPATSTVRTAPPANTPRQPMVVLSQASGVAATSAPEEPSPVSRPETVE